MLKVLSSCDREGKGLLKQALKRKKSTNFSGEKKNINNEALHSVYFLWIRQVVVVLVDLESTRLHCYMQYKLKSDRFWTFYHLRIN